MFIHDDTYLATQNIEEIFRDVKKSEKGMSAFIKDAKRVGTKMKNGSHSFYVYKDEEALFKVFQKHLPDELKSLGIDCFGRLMQYVS